MEKQAVTIVKDEAKESKVAISSVEGNATFDFEKTKMEPPPKEVSDDDFRTLSIKVPSNIPDAVVNAAWQTGMQVVQMINAGFVTILFPNSVKDKNGKMRPSISQLNVLVKSNEDIEALLNLAATITKVNLAAAEAAKRGPADKLSADVMAAKIKGNLSQEAESKASGKPKIIIANR